MTKIFLIACVALCVAALAGCNTFKGDTVTASIAGGGASLSAAPTVSVTLGYAQADIHKVPTLDSKGLPVKFAGPCGVEYGVSTYGILNGNATASSQGAGPQAAVAINRGAMTGEAAVHESLADVARTGGSPAADIERARLDCSRSTPPAAADTAAGPPTH